MVVDTSAIVAMILRERERFVFDDLILRTPTVVMSVVSVVETMIVLVNQRREPEAAKLDETLSELRIDVRGVDGRQGLLARKAFEQYGRGRSPAALNFGDCFAYALAKARDDILLFKGDDFSKTDIVPAWRPVES
jgi:ribonuclease VapC